MNPKQKQGTERRELPNGESAVLEPATQTLVVLNPIADVVWTLCDGTRTAEAIAGLIASEFPEVSTEQVERDVGAVLADLHQRGFVEDATCPPTDSSS